MNRHMIQLTEEQRDAARAIGNGNLARGVRRAVVFTMAAYADVAIPLDEKQAIRKEPLDISK